MLPVTTDVSDLIGNLSDLLHRTLGETVDLKVDVTPGLWLATVDAHQLENAVVNLAVNARDAMPSGGSLAIATANITLDEAYTQNQDEVAPGDYVCVAVSDTGTGMTPEVREKAFEPFFTTKEAGKGSGLGLSMVYGFSKQSKGHVTIDTEEDSGTIIKLYLPRSFDPLIPQIDTGNHTPEFALGSERILVVEDDELLRGIPVSVLRKQGYEVMEARDGQEAIKHLKDGQCFDLLFVDVVLPGGMNGIEVADQAKLIQPNIKVIFTTGYSENAVVHKGQLNPGLNLINKPYGKAEFLGKVRAMLDSVDP